LKYDRGIALVRSANSQRLHARFPYSNQPVLEPSVTDETSPGLFRNEPSLL
jgi:hypothetical protein